MLHRFAGKLKAYIQVFTFSSTTIFAPMFALISTYSSSLNSTPVSI